MAYENGGGKYKTDTLSEIYINHITGVIVQKWEMNINEGGYTFFTSLSRVLYVGRVNNEMLVSQLTMLIFFCRRWVVHYAIYVVIPFFIHETKIKDTQI